MSTTGPALCLQVDGLEEQWAIRRAFALASFQAAKLRDRSRYDQILDLSGRFDTLSLEAEASVKPGTASAFGFPMSVHDAVLLLVALDGRLKDLQARPRTLNTSLGHEETRRVLRKLRLNLSPSA